MSTHCRAWCAPRLGSLPYLYVWHLSLTYHSYSEFLYHTDRYWLIPAYHQPLPVMTGPSTSSLHIPHYHFYYHPLLFWTCISPLLLGRAPAFTQSLFLVHLSTGQPCRPYQRPVPCGNLYGSVLYHFFYSFTSPSLVTSFSVQTVSGIPRTIKRCAWYLKNSLLVGFLNCSN